MRASIRSSTSAPTWAARRSRPQRCSAARRRCGRGRPVRPALFNAGLPAERRAAQAALEAAAANYQRVVLDALRNVADALRAVEYDAESMAALSRSVQATEEQHRVLQSQYRAGAASAVQLLVADQMLLQARSGLIAAQAQRLADTVALGAALAGDPLRQVRGIRRRSDPEPDST